MFTTISVALLTRPTRKTFHFLRSIAQMRIDELMQPETGTRRRLHCLLVGRFLMMSPGKTLLSLRSTPL
jgi:hypothetical protein